jgi:hypothetical protein
LFDLVIPLLGRYPKELKAGTQQVWYTYFHMTAFVIIAKRWEKTKHPSVDEK